VLDVIVVVMPEDKVITPAKEPSKPSSPKASKPSSPKALKPSSPKAAPASSPKVSSSKPAQEESKTNKEEAAPPKPATASRDDNLTYDLKHLAAFDIAPLNPKVNFLDYTRDSVQLLVNKIFALPTDKADVGLCAVLPETELFRLPRSKLCPKEKPQTRWAKFMEEKNMQKRKRSRMIFDEATDEYKPRWGYKSAKNSQDTGFHEVKPGQDPNENPFEKVKAERKLQIARQKMREVRNKVEALGGKLKAAAPDLTQGWKGASDKYQKGDNKGAQRGKDGLKEAVKRAQMSSASMGKFDRVSPNEATNLQMKKKSGTAAQSAGQEKDRMLKSATRILSGEGGIDSAKARKLGISQDKRGGQATGIGKGKGKGKGGAKRRSKQGGKKRK